jgi:hypothetical protein
MLLTCHRLKSPKPYGCALNETVPIITSNRPNRKLAAKESGSVPTNAPSIQGSSPGTNLQISPRHADKHSVETDYLTVLAARLSREACFP